MNKKKWILILIIAFPSFFWLILETSTINSKKLNYYGPKKPLGGKDTSYYTVSDEFYKFSDLRPTNEIVKLPLKEYPLYAAVFINEKYKNETYRLNALWEFLNYKKEKVIHIPFVLITSSLNGISPSFTELNKLAHHKNVTFLHLPDSAFKKTVKSYFLEKPYYIDYSFFVLVDANRNIRGFYDGRYVSEIKRLTEEYKHLRLKEEKKLLINENEIIQDK